MFQSRIKVTSDRIEGYLYALDATPTVVVNLFTGELTMKRELPAHRLLRQKMVDLQNQVLAEYELFTAKA